MSTHFQFGRLGEAAAERLYVARGYRVVCRNWRCGLGELDLVLRRGDTLVICEVKSRRGSRFGGGYEAVDARKRRKVRAVSEVFLRSGTAPPAHLRFDVASVLVGRDGSASVEVFEDAF